MINFFLLSYLSFSLLSAKFFRKIFLLAETNAQIMVLRSFNNNVAGANVSIILCTMWTHTLTQLQHISIFTEAYYKFQSLNNNANLRMRPDGQVAPANQNQQLPNALGAGIGFLAGALFGGFYPYNWHWPYYCCYPG